MKSFKFLITSLFFWAVTAVAAQNSVGIEIVVHRGANALAPENTIASADSALKYGAKWIEVDVRKSKDGELFNLHDETLDRTTNGKGLLSEMLAKDVRKVDAGSWFGPQFEGTPLPSIAEMLDFLKGKANVFFDVKRGTPIPSLVKLVREKGFADKSFFWFGDEAMLHEFTALAPEMKIKVNAGDIDRLIYWQRICKPSYVEIAPEKITDAFRAYCLRTDLLAIPSDGKTLCTQQLQQAIDQINEKGGGRLVLARGAYLIGGLMLRSGVELFLEEGATLLGSTNPDDYQPISISHTDDTRNDNASMALLMADKAEHISITGSGTIDGQGLALALNIDSLHHTGERLDPYYNQRRQRPSEMARPKLLFIHDCKDIHVTGIKLRNSANWGLSFHLCEQLSLLRLDIENRAYWNNDGIDLTDCRHVLVADCQINSADDGVCLKSYHADRECYDIEIARLSIRSSASAVKFGTASWGGFRNIYVHDLKVRDTFRSAIAIESVDGAKIDSVLVERIDAKNTGNPIFLRLGQRAGERKGSLRNVTIRNFTCEVPFGRPDEAYDLRGPEVDFFHNPFPSSICGIPDNPIENVVLENINITYPGRATKGMAYMPLWRKGDVPEQINKYPEFTMFGELPAWGFYLRHIRSILLKNVQLSLRDEDYRPSIVDEDVEGLVIIHNP